MTQFIRVTWLNPCVSHDLIHICDNKDHQIPWLSVLWLTKVVTCWVAACVAAHMAVCCSVCCSVLQCVLLVLSVADKGCDILSWSVCCSVCCSVLQSELQHYCYGREWVWHTGAFTCVCHLFFKLKSCHIVIWMLQYAAVCCSACCSVSNFEMLIVQLYLHLESFQTVIWVLQCVAVCCSALQCVAVCCSVLQWTAVCCSVLQCAAVCCSVLQCAAVCCSVLQCAAVCPFLCVTELLPWPTMAVTLCPSEHSHRSHGWHAPWTFTHENCTHVNWVMGHVRMFIGEWQCLNLNTWHV